MVDGGVFFFFVFFSVYTGAVRKEKIVDLQYTIHNTWAPRPVPYTVVDKRSFIGVIKHQTVMTKVTTTNNEQRPSLEFVSDHSSPKETNHLN
jgi:hypothetical protein